MLGFFSLLSIGVFSQSEIFAPMKSALKAGSAKELANLLNTSAEINVEGNVNSYSKAQAEFVFRDFFKKHPVTDFSIVHTGVSKGGLQYAIGRYVCAAESYNVLIRVREIEGINLIHEINFVKE